MGVPPLLHLGGALTGNRLPFAYSAGIMWWAFPQLLQICFDAPLGAAVAGAVLQLATNIASYFLHPEVTMLKLREMTVRKWAIVGVVVVLGASCIIAGGVNVSSVESLPSFNIANGTLTINSTSERATPFLESLMEAGLSTLFFSTAYISESQPEMFISLLCGAQLMMSSFSIALRRGDLALSPGLWAEISTSSIAAGSLYFFLSLTVMIMSGLWLSKMLEKEAKPTPVDEELHSPLERAKTWIAATLYLSASLGLTGAILVWVMQHYGQYVWTAFCLLSAIFLTIPAYIMGASLPYLACYGFFLSAVGPLSFGMRYVNPEISAGAIMLIIFCFLVWVSFPLQYDHEVDNKLRIYAGSSAAVVFIGCIVASIGAVATPYFADEIASRGALTALFFLGGVLGQNKEFSVVPFLLGSMLVHSFGGCYSINSNTGQAGSVIVWIGSMIMTALYYRKLESAGQLAALPAEETDPIIRSDFPPAASAIPESETQLPSEESNVTL